MPLVRARRSLMIPVATLALLTFVVEPSHAQATAAKTVPVTKRPDHAGQSDASAGRGASDASAGRSADIYVKVQPVKGQHRVIRCPDGLCTIGGLPADKYMVSLSNAAGSDVASEASLTYTVQSPRDAASGMATGKRQHSPMKITKEWDRTIPANLIDVAESGSTLTMQVTASINTTRSNIKRLDQ